MMQVSAFPAALHTVSVMCQQGCTVGGATAQSHCSISSLNLLPLLLQHDNIETFQPTPATADTLHLSGCYRSSFQYPYITIKFSVYNNQTFFYSGHVRLSDLGLAVELPPGKDKTTGYAGTPGNWRNAILCYNMGLITVSR